MNPPLITMISFRNRFEKKILVYLLESYNVTVYRAKGKRGGALTRPQLAELYQRWDAIERHCESDPDMEAVTVTLIEGGFDIENFWD